MELPVLEIFDYIVLAIFGLSVYVGWKNGLIQSMIAFFAWFGSIVIVADNYEHVFNFVNQFVNSKFISGFIASIGFYIILVVLFSLIGSKISDKIEKFGGSATDKITGGIFGAFCGGLLSCLIFWFCYMGLTTLNDQKFPKWFSEAKTYKILKIGSDALIDFSTSPEERKKLINLIKKKSNSLEDEVRKNIHSNDKTRDTNENSVNE